MKYVGGWARLCALIVISLSLVACGKKTSLESGLPSASSSLSGATTAYPGVVMVQLGSSGMCSGTIISTKAVLTASHCTKEGGPFVAYVYDTSGALIQSPTALSYASADNDAGVVNDVNDVSILFFANNTFDSSLVVKVGSSVSTGDTLRLVGYGCNDLNTKSGAGVKRTGTNVVADTSNGYVEFLTPETSSAQSYLGILGASNRAGSCFGDSGGPALATVNGELEVVAVTHAGGTEGSDILSQYVDIVNNTTNRNFLSSMNSSHGLGMSGF